MRTAFLLFLRTVDCGPWTVVENTMIHLKGHTHLLFYFVIPFLAGAAVAVGAYVRIAQDGPALKIAQEYLDSQFPGIHWELEKKMKVGDGLGKKWRLEFKASRKDGRLMHANLLIDRWHPQNLVGRYVFLLDPPQILDGKWETSSADEGITGKISQRGLVFIGVLVLTLQCIWLYWIYRQQRFRKGAGLLLAFLGIAFLAIQVMVEVHPVFMAGYALVFISLGWTILGGTRMGNA